MRLQEPLFMSHALIIAFGTHARVLSQHKKHKSKKENENITQFDVHGSSCDKMQMNVSRANQNDLQNETVFHLCRVSC